MTENPTSDVETPSGTSTSTHNRDAIVIMTRSVTTKTSKNTTPEKENNTGNTNNNKERNYRDERYDLKVISVANDYNGATPEIGGVLCS